MQWRQAFDQAIPETGRRRISVITIGAGIRNSDFVNLKLLDDFHLSSDDLLDLLNHEQSGRFYSRFGSHEEVNDMTTR